MHFNFAITHSRQSIGHGRCTFKSSSFKRLSGRRSENYETQMYVNAVYNSLPANERWIEQIKEHQREDKVCKQLCMYCKQSWPNKDGVPSPLKPYYPFAYELTVINDLLMSGSRIVIPSAMWLGQKLHEGRLGITKNRMRAKQSVWWPGLASQIEQMVKSCRRCSKLQSQHAQPLIPCRLPELPWQRVAIPLTWLTITLRGDG